MRAERMLRYLAKRWFLLLVLVGVALALEYPALAQRVLEPVQTRYIAAAVLLLMSAGLQTGRLWQAVRRPGPVIVALFVTFGLSPLLAHFAGRMLLEPEYQIGLTIAGCLPCTLASATIWTRLAEGNEAVSMLVTMLTNTLVFLATAGWLAWLTGQTVRVDLSGMMFGLVVYVVAPILLGQLARQSSAVAALADRRRRILSIACRLLILTIIVKSTVEANLRLHATGGSWTLEQLVVVALVCMGVHLVLLYAGFLLARSRYALEDAVAVAFSGSQKTLPVGAYIIAEHYAAAPLAIVPLLFFHVGQLVVDTYIAERFFYRAGHPELDAAEAAIADPSAERAGEG
jgi:sodium/bile acid cotransporter 7